uniref:RNA polymerase sigma factor sigA-like n=1 Tax=Cicer arietinum TaxID=3827 RepID=A0A1S3E683_CICAR|nr:RNA polymerase sigma factor sigA-like [Cicer arietinum]
MATAAVIGLSGGKRLLSSSYHYSDVIEKFYHGCDFGSSQYHLPPSKSVILSKKSSKCAPTFPAYDRQNHSIKALKEHAVVVDDAPAIANSEPWFQGGCNSNSDLELELETSDINCYSVDDRKQSLAESFSLHLLLTCAVVFMNKEIERFLKAIAAFDTVKNHWYDRN